MDDRLDQILRVLGADDDVAELAWAGNGLVLVDRERQDVGGPVLATVLAVQLLDACLVDQLDREMALPHARGRESRFSRAPEARIIGVDLDHACGSAAAGLSARRADAAQVPGVTRARRRPPRSAGRACAGRRPPASGG